MYGASYIPGLVSRFMLTAASGNQVRVLPVGVQLSNRIVQYNTNVTYAVDVEDPTQDLLLTLSPTYGGMAMVVQKHYRSDIDPNDPNAGLYLPGCYLGHSGAQMGCTNYTWLVSTATGAAALYIPAGSPCNPPQAYGVNPVVVSNSCNVTTDWGAGRYFVTVYGINKGLSQYALSAQGGGRGPNDIVTLAEGQPQVGMTANYTLCPARDPATGQCLPPISGWTGPVAATYFSFRVPIQRLAGASTTQYAFVERLCAGRSTGDCGFPLSVYVRACVDTTCTAVDTYPYPATVFDYSYTMGTDETTAALNIPFGGCANVTSGGDCVYFVGVYPQCGGPTPGSGCPASDVFRFTYSGDTGTTRVPVDCFSDAFNETCALPVETLALNDVARYEALLPTDGATPGSVALTSCLGTASLFVCLPFANGPRSSKCKCV